MRQWTATHLAKLARKASIAAGKKVQIYLDKLPAKWIKYIKKISCTVDDIVLLVGLMVKRRHLIL